MNIYNMKYIHRYNNFIMSMNPQNKSIKLDLFMGRVTSASSKVYPKFGRVRAKILGPKMGLGKKLGPFKKWIELGLEKHNA